MEEKEQRNASGEEAEHRADGTADPDRAPVGRRSHRLGEVSHGRDCALAGSRSNTQCQRHVRFFLSSCFHCPWSHLCSRRVVVRKIFRQPCLPTAVLCHGSETPSVSVLSLTHPGKMGRGCSLTPGTASQPSKRILGWRCKSLCAHGPAPEACFQLTLVLLVSLRSSVLGTRRHVSVKGWVN